MPKVEKKIIKWTFVKLTKLMQSAILSINVEVYIQTLFPTFENYFSSISKFAHIFNHLHNLNEEISLQKIHCRRVRNGRRITQLNIFFSILSLMIIIPFLKGRNLPKANTLSTVYTPLITTEEGKQVSR